MFFRRQWAKKCFSRKALMVSPASHVHRGSNWTSSASSYRSMKSSSLLSSSTPWPCIHKEPGWPDVHAESGEGWVACTRNPWWRNNWSTEGSDWSGNIGRASPGAFGGVAWEEARGIWGVVWEGVAGGWVVLPHVATLLQLSYQQTMSFFVAQYICNKFLLFLRNLHLSFDDWLCPFGQTPYCKLLTTHSKRKKSRVRDQVLLDMDA